MGKAIETDYDGFKCMTYIVFFNSTTNMYIIVYLFEMSMEIVNIDETSRTWRFINLKPTSAIIAENKDLLMHLIGSMGYINYKEGDEIATKYSKFALIFTVTRYLIDIPMLYIYYVKDKTFCFVYYDEINFDQLI